MAIVQHHRFSLARSLFVFLQNDWTKAKEPFDRAAAVLRLINEFERMQGFESTAIPPILKLIDLCPRLSLSIAAG
jgi:hypothetical protein